MSRWFTLSGGIVVIRGRKTVDCSASTSRLTKNVSHDRLYKFCGAHIDDNNNDGHKGKRFIESKNNQKEGLSVKF